MRLYGIQAKDTDLVNMAAEIKIRAERRAGELLVKMEMAKGVAGGRERDSAGRTVRLAEDVPTLTALGLTKSQSSRFQWVAT